MIDPSVLKHEKKRTLKARAVAQLRKAITRGELKPGTRLVEQELSTLLGISRMPIREAIVNLEQAGLVTIIPYKGAVVSSFSMREIKEFFDVRALLETHALHLFLQKRDPKPLARLYEVADAMGKEAEGEAGDLALHDYNFHSTLCSLGENQVLCETWFGLSAKTQCCIAFEMQQFSHEEAEIMHRHICDLIREGDFELAARELREHLDWGKSLALRHFNYPRDEGCGE